MLQNQNRDEKCRRFNNIHHERVNRASVEVPRNPCSVMDPKQGPPPHIDTTGEGRETVGTRECHAPTMPCLSLNVMEFPGRINLIDTLSHGVIYNNTSRVMS